MKNKIQNLILKALRINIACLLVLSIFGIGFLDKVSNFISIETFAYSAGRSSLGKSGVASSDIVHINKKYLQAYSGIEREAENINVAKSANVKVRLYYNNTSDQAITGAQIQDSLPTGFSFVNNTLRNCIQPSLVEESCSGALSNSLFSGSNLSVSPVAGLYDANSAPASGGTATNATSGFLEMGKKRYLNMDSCTYYKSSTDTWFQSWVDRAFNNLYDSAPNVSNTSEVITNCGPGEGPLATNYSSNVWSTGSSYDMMAKRYLNMHRCTYYYSASDAWFSSFADLKFNLIPDEYDAGTKTSNALDTTPSCGSGTAGYPYTATWSDVNNFSFLGNRYFNIHQCTYYRSVTDTWFTGINNPSFNNQYDSGTNTSNVNNTTVNCGPGNANFVYSPTWSDLKSLDLSDIRRGKGFIEYQMTAPTTSGSYGASASIVNATGGANPITVTATDDYIDGVENTITVLDTNTTSATLNIRYLNGAFETSTLNITPSQTITVRGKYNNNGNATIPNSVLNFTAPAGFTILPSSFRNCLTPTTLISICSPTFTPTGSVITGQNITVSPNIGLYDTAVSGIGTALNSISGALNIGQKAFITRRGCTGYGANDINNVKIHENMIATNTNTTPSYQCYLSDNTLNPAPIPIHNAISSIIGGFAAGSSETEEITGKRFIQIIKCQSSKLSGSVVDILTGILFGGFAPNNAGATTPTYTTSGCENSITGSPFVTTGGSNYNTESGKSSLLTDEVMGKRYIVRHNCLTKSNSSEEYLTDSFVSKGFLTTNTPTAYPDSCTNINYARTNAGGDHTAIWGKTEILDLLDQTRGGGYIQFQMTAPSGLTAGTYSTASRITSGSFNTTLASDMGLLYNPGTISGKVFYDNNGNNVNDSGSELNGVLGTTIRIKRASDNVSFGSYTTTSGNMNYSFAVPAGIYYLESTTIPTGYNIAQKLATSTTNNDFNPSGISVNKTDNFTLAIGGTETNIDLGLQYNNDLSIQKTSSGGANSIGSVIGKFFQGNTAWYDLTVTNNTAYGTIATTTVSDTLPSLLVSKYTGYTGTGWTCNLVTSTVTCITSDVIPANGNKTVRLNFSTL
jgi:hypothetical protein